MWPSALGVLFAILASAELIKTILCFYRGWKSQKHTAYDEGVCLLANAIGLGLAALIILIITKI